MADSSNDKTISKTNTGFPDYLDFNKLRSSAIEYLGKLAGKIWTDHNVHDPGITILESLIYALLDLGYRTNLPAGDLFTRDPADNTPDNNFFKASRILGNNPLTITDYRKLLVDLEGVKNAWLEVDDSIPVDFCKNRKAQPADDTEPVLLEAFVAEEDYCKCNNLNGLYHVFIQLEEGIDQNKHLYEKTIRRIRESLMAHRNLCEDFVDIKVLCKLELGICVEIDLETDADAEEVYVNMVEALQEFLSPSPRFYSLQQLLDKQKPIDEIFSGRPFNIKESHGFIDTDEFEQLKLRKELHLSDVYHLLSDIKGVRRIRNLGWIKCCKDKISVPEWTLVLPENHIPAFSPACSGFIFTRNGLPEKVDLKKFESYFEMKFSGVQKALYTEPSDFLDPILPQGVYRNDLADYYSIQNEFPKVYGISEGGLASDQPDSRKAQALQLQGFLLFFDQLLANYLTQLKNIRSLFSLSSSKEASDNHTYFINQLTNAPQMQKLLRFHIDEDGNNTLGTQGSILAYPTDRKKIQALIDSGKLKNSDLERRCNNPCEDDFPGYEFCFAEERDLALNQLKDDFLFGDCKPVIVSNSNDCYFFYFFTTSADLALISKHYYKDRKQAEDAAASVKYSATFIENYRSFIIRNKTEDEYFSFDVELNLDVYSKYLQLIVEDKELYLKRRQDFLNHLLSRFAETFTDYALLSAPFISSNDLPELEIKAEERFLSHYDDISSNRGKAYDYLKNKWNTTNISGFEKRVKALAGIDNWNRHYLCNFVVEPADKLYRLSILLFDLAFSVPEKTFDEKEGLASLKSIYKKLLSPVFEYDYVSYQKQYQVYIQDDFGNKYRIGKFFDREEKAESFVKTLDTAFKFRPDPATDVFISKYIYKVILTSTEGKLIAESKQHFPEKADADNFGKKVAGKLSNSLKDENEFTKVGRSRKLDKLIVVSVDKFPFIFINENEFEWKPTEVFHLKEERKRFSILNKKASFQFDSIKDFPNTRSAKESYRSILPLLTRASSYLIEKNKQTENFEMFVSDGSEKLARYFDSFSSEELAKKKMLEILEEINTYTYRLLVTDPLPDEWEFKYRSGDETGNFIDYFSQGNYRSSELAFKAATAFYTNLKDLSLRLTEGKLLLALKSNSLNIRAVAQLDKPDSEARKKAQSILSSGKRLYQTVSDSSDKILMDILKKNRINPGEDFVYKLVDKDNLLAFHPVLNPIKTYADAVSRKDKLIQEALKGYTYIDIALGSDIIRKRKDEKTKIFWYHYLVKCNNRKYQKGKFAGQDLILFESIRGYASSDDALDAFRQEYLLVLKYAGKTNNYGKGQVISMEELLVNSSDACDNSKSLVFVPKETLIEFGDYEVQKTLAPIAESYPVRYAGKKKYVFIIGMLDNIANTFSMEWVSCREFSTPAEAMNQFQFFLILLKYPGNFYVEWSTLHCKYEIFIREVLAISAHGFATREEAWGEEGIEKFICVSQSDNGFHNYVNRVTCNPGFYVACNNTGLQHPCTYDTPSRRDQVMDQLYHASGFNFMDLVQTVGQDKIILTDLQKNPLAIIHIGEKSRLNYSACEWLLHFMESVYIEKNYVKKGGHFSLNHRYTLDNEKQERYYKMAEPASASISFRNWKQELQKIACYFPVRRVKNTCNSGGKDQYAVEIKLPGFDPCCRDTLSDDPNSSPCREPDCTPSCYTSWISDCCFEDCCQALDFYLSSWILLKNFENYKPVYNCNCGPYGIELHTQLTLKEKAEYLKESGVVSRANSLCSGYKMEGDATVNKSLNRLGTEISCFSEIVAINPQFYSNPDMACNAVDRSKRLINSDGMHLVEHILLRPRCSDEKGNYAECNCDGQPRPCIDKDQLCHFQWKPGGETDPCEVNNTVCLTPGCDPYSFIATLVLPAWTERFRSESGRKIIEKLLQKEAPAHVLLRILWLRPRDFCCMEFYDKLWLQWLANKLCDPGYNNCDFLNLLFNKEFQPLPECRDCIPCDCGNDQPDTCNPGSGDRCEGIDVLSNINQLFCWTKDREYKFTYCESGMRERLIGNRPAEIITKPEAINKTVPLIEKKPPEPAKELKIKKDIQSVKASKAENEIQPAKTGDQLLKDKFRFVQSRAHRYEIRMNTLKELFPDKNLVTNAIIFLKKSKPSPAEYNELANAVINDRTNNARGIRGLNKSQKQEVIESITWKYLDSVCFNGKDLDMILALKSGFRFLREKGIDMNMIYKGWESEKLSSFEPGIDYKKIKKWLLGQ